MGALVGLMVVIPISLRFDPTDDENALPTLAVMFVPFVLIFVGEGVSGLIGAMREISGPIRVASSRAPRLSDLRPGPVSRSVPVKPASCGARSDALPRFYGTPAMHLGPDLVFAFSLLVLGLSVAGQFLLLRTPRSHGRQPTLLTSPHPYEQA